VTTTADPGPGGTGRLRGAVAEVLASVLLIRPGEGRRTALLFVHLLLASAVFILGRTVRDTLFLSRYSLAALPWMFVCYGVASALTVLIYAQVADRVARHKLIVASVGVGVLTYLGTWVAVRAQAAWIYPTFYVWSEVAANLFIVQFWTLANDLHDARAAKRLFGTIGSARVLGVVIVGLGTGVVVKAIGTPQLLFVLVALMGLIAVIALLLARVPRAEGAVSAARHGRRRGPPPKIFASPYVRALAVVILLTFMALTIGDYQFKAIARATYREDALARFFSLFYAATGIISFVFQILVTPRLLARLGVGWGLAVMPGVFGAASALLLPFPSLAVVTPMKFADNGFQYTIHETTLQALYVPFPQEVKARTRAVLDAVVKPLSYGVGGVVLILLASRLSVGQLAFVTVPLVALWFACIPVVKRRYVQALEATLSTHGALGDDHELVLDSAGRAALIRVIQRGAPRQALMALEQLQDERSPEFVAAVTALTAHADPELRAAALARLGAMPDARSEAVAAALADPAPAVRAAAAQAHAALAGDEAVEALAPLLADPEREVRVAAATGLLANGGVEGGIVGGAHLGGLLASAGREPRIEAARVLRGLGRGAFRPLRRLLGDPEAAVRRAALRAAVSCSDPRLAPALIAMLADPACRHKAGLALCAIGAPAVAPLCALLEDPAAPRAVKLIVPRLLRRIPHPEAYTRLRDLPRTDDAHLRLRIYSGLSHLRAALRRDGERLAVVAGLVRAEVREAYGLMAGWEAARPVYDSPLLAEELTFQHARTVRRVLRVLELRYHPEPVRLVRERLADPARRANAMEVLDTLLEPPLRLLVMPFLDDVPVAERLKRAGGLVPPPPAPADFLRARCRDPNPYVAHVALDALARRRDPIGAEEGRRALAHPDPLVREAAVLAVAAGAERTAAAEALRDLTTDGDAIVAAHARGALARLDGAAPETPMYSTVEKILFLKSAPVFARLSGEDLAPLARIAEVATYAAGQKVFAEGELGDALFVIIRGAVRILRGGETLAELGPGEPFGEMAVLDEVPRSATAVALGEAELLRIGSEEFYEILHEQVEIAEGVIRMLTHRLREADARLQEAREAGARRVAG
jgi:ATP/ADP translocase/HEAT repeat protein